jgi:hypothetical protein
MRQVSVLLLLQLLLLLAGSQNLAKGYKSEASTYILLHVVEWLVTKLPAALPPRPRTAAPNPTGCIYPVADQVEFAILTFTCGSATAYTGTASLLRPLLGLVWLRTGRRLLGTALVLPAARRDSALWRCIPQVVCMSIHC